MNSTTKIKGFGVFLLYLLISLHSFAQYEGGNGAGEASLSFANQACISYFGSEASGFSTFEWSNSPCVNFFGDSLSGYGYADVQLSNCTLFEGGDNSGHNLNHFVHPETCVMFTESANGGSGYYGQSITEENNPCVVIALGVDGSPLFGEIINNDGVLKWQTFGERNNQGFEILKSADGLDWEVIGWVDGRVYSNETVFYSFIDENLKSFGQYYRFRQVDFNGFQTFSNIIFLKPDLQIDINDVFVLYPNPSKGGTAIYLKAWTSREWIVDIKILDTSGRLLAIEKQFFDFSSKPYTLPTEDFPPGTYFLFLSNEDQSQNMKITFVII